MLDFVVIRVLFSLLWPLSEAYEILPIGGQSSSSSCSFLSMVLYFFFKAGLKRNFLIRDMIFKSTIKN